MTEHGALQRLLLVYRTPAEQIAAGRTPTPMGSMPGMNMSSSASGSMPGTTTK